MNWREYYLREVYPCLDLRLAEKYPLVSLIEGDGRKPLGCQALVMLVALTGTGKSTTLDRLRARRADIGAGSIPTRRELADWIAIPLAQALAGEPLARARDRRKRFAHTRRFAQRVPGGMAAAFSWLNIADSFDGLIVAEGIRGANEIRYALEHFPRWKIVELALNPVTRLRRLSGRVDDFDQAGGGSDLSFLPRALRAEAEAGLKAGQISGKALAIMQAEAANYGLEPFAAGQSYANYFQIDMEERDPDEAAAALASIMEGMEAATCPE
ncbi:MAG: hypothetical protein OXG85_15935 [Chloroflexi bacterium]|nr:hypothetical protein [Chloroflexota bacterium]